MIGGNILSGRTKDQNIAYIAEYLMAVGINLKEVRVVGDEESAVVEHTQCAPGIATPMSSQPALIGPIHGDITAYFVAMAFGVQIDTDPRALAILYEWVKTTGPR